MVLEERARTTRSLRSSAKWATALALLALGPGCFSTLATSKIPCREGAEQVLRYEPRDAVAVEIDRGSLRARVNGRESAVLVCADVLPDGTPVPASARADGALAFGDARLAPRDPWLVELGASRPSRVVVLRHAGDVDAVLALEGDRWVSHVASEEHGHTRAGAALGTAALLCLTVPLDLATSPIQLPLLVACPGALMAFLWICGVKE